MNAIHKARINDNEETPAERRARKEAFARRDAADYRARRKEEARERYGYDADDY